MPNSAPSDNPSPRSALERVAKLPHVYNSKWPFQSIMEWALSLVPSKPRATARAKQPRSDSTAGPATGAPLSPHLLAAAAWGLSHRGPESSSRLDVIVRDHIRLRGLSSRSAWGGRGITGEQLGSGKAAGVFDIPSRMYCYWKILLPEGDKASRTNDPVGTGTTNKAQTPVSRKPGVPSTPPDHIQRATPPQK